MREVAPKLTKHWCNLAASRPRPGQDLVERPCPRHCLLGLYSCVHSSRVSQQQLRLSDPPDRNSISKGTWCLWTTDHRPSRACRATSVKCTSAIAPLGQEHASSVHVGAAQGEVRKMKSSLRTHAAHKPPERPGQALGDVA